MIKNKVYCVIGYDNHLMEGNVYEYEYTEDGAIILQVYDHFKIVDQNFLNHHFITMQEYRKRKIKTFLENSCTVK